MSDATTITLEGRFTIGLVSNKRGETFLEIVSHQDRIGLLEPLALDFGSHAGDVPFQSILWPSGDTETRRVFVHLTPFQGESLKEILNRAILDGLETALDKMLDRETHFAALVRQYYHREEGSS